MARAGEKNWDEEADAALRRAAREGRTMKEAGAALGVSRSAVAGRAARIGVRFPVTPSKKWSSARRMDARPAARLAR